MGGLPLDRCVSVLGHPERANAILVAELGVRRRRDTAPAGEKYEPVVHAENEDVFQTVGQGRGLLTPRNQSPQKCAYSTTRDALRARDNSHEHGNSTSNPP